MQDLRRITLSKKLLVLITMSSENNALLNGAFSTGVTFPDTKAQHI